MTPDLGHLSRDQRTGHWWSDPGLTTIAIGMVHVAEVRGRLGSELLTIEISGTRAALHLVIWQLTNKNLNEQAPLVRFWRHQGEDVVENSDDLTLDFDRYKAPEAENETYRQKRYHIVLELLDVLDIDEVNVGDACYSISIEGRDAPRCARFRSWTRASSGMTSGSDSRPIGRSPPWRWLRAHVKDRTMRGEIVTLICIKISPMLQKQFWTRLAGIGGGGTSIALFDMSIG